MKRDRQLAIETAIQASPNARITSLPASGLPVASPTPRESRQNAQFEDGIRTVVVPLDGSPHAEHALPHALAIVRLTGASLRLLRVYSHLDDINPWEFSRAADGIKRSKHEKWDYLARIARKIARTTGLQPDTLLIDSPDTVDALVNGAADADLVVIGSRRGGLMSRLWWGDQADRLRRRLSVPLLLTAGDSREVDLAANPRFRNILVPLDGSVLGQAVLGSAARLPRASGGSITLLNVQNESWSLGCFEHTNPRSYLLSKVQHLKRKGVRADAQVVATSRGPAEAIASYADSHDVDLIAIATRGDSGFSRLMRGSVADALRRNVKLPILLQNVPDVVQRPETISIR